MISFAKNGRRNSQRLSHGHPAGLFLWVLSSILLLQTFIVASGAFRTYIYISDKLEVGLPSAYWWATIGVRGCVWLVLIPPLAAIIADRNSSIWQSALLHVGLLIVAVYVSGIYLHRFAHIQSDQLNHLVDIKKLGESDDTSGGQKTVSSNARARLNAAAEDYTDKSYEGVNFHNSYGLGYWIGEFSIIFSTYLMMNAVGYAMLYLRITGHRTRQAEQLRTTVAQLQHESLCNRLTPHFLFNTLNTISSLTLTDGKAARTCISQLGELLRQSIESLPEGEIRLDKEIDILLAYLKIQKTRFGYKLEYSIDVEEGLESVLVPAFMLQPLVENSFKHGFQEHEDIARVGISAKRQGNYCLLEISDNGAKVDSAQPLDENYGLGLTRQRLKLQYGQDAKLSYEPNLPCGLKVIVLVPLHVQAGEIA
jgi:two-component sensor histidine kinase